MQNGGVLTGVGIVSGSVTVAAGAQLAPGTPFGNLTLGGNLSLASASSTWLAIQHAPLTNASVTLAGNLAASGALIITNAGGSALAAGDSFQLLTAANYTGAFTSLTLPALGANLYWNTNELMTSGILSVVTLTSPAISTIQFSGTELAVTGAGGIPGWSYAMLATTNLTTGSWLPVATNQFDSAGNFMLTLTNAAFANQPATFYKLQLK
jgi:hypothetical protein